MCLFEELFKILRSFINLCIISKLDPCVIVEVASSITETINALKMDVTKYSKKEFKNLDVSLRDCFM